MTESASRDWADWRRSVFGDPYLVWHDGADFSALLHLARTGTDEDRDRVREMLALGLREGDPLAALTLGVLAESGAAVPDSEALLREALAAAQDTPNTFLTAIASSLRAVTGHEAWSAQIIRVLTAAPDWNPRVDAALALARVDPGPEVVDALTLAIVDPEYLVRYHAARTLLRHAYPTAGIERRPALFAQLSNSTASGPQEWQDAAKRLATECRSRIDRRRASRRPA